MPVSYLPTELFTCILECIHPDERQGAAASLLIALPRTPVPRYHIFQNGIRIKTDTRVVLFEKYLRDFPDDIALIRVFSLEAWSLDADVAINAIRKLTALERLTIYVGPNFAPEHLEELLERPFASLKYLAIRFRP